MCHPQGKVTASRGMLGYEPEHLLRLVLCSPVPVHKVNSLLQSWCFFTQGSKVTGDKLTQKHIANKRLGVSRLLRFCWLHDKWRSPCTNHQRLLCQITITYSRCDQINRHGFVTARGSKIQKQFPLLKFQLHVWAWISCWLEVNLCKPEQLKLIVLIQSCHRNVCNTDCNTVCFSSSRDWIACRWLVWGVELCHSWKCDFPLTNTPFCSIY